MTKPSAELATFAAQLRFEHIPTSVIQKTEDLLVDWFGSAVAGAGSAPVEAVVRFAKTMGAQDGAHGAEILPLRGFSSPYLAAMANAASSHVAEQDDVHNGSVFHPATVVFSPALAVAQSIGASGAAFLCAAVAGYEVGIRVGEFLGRSHYKVFHTTGTAGTLAAAAAVGNLLGLDALQMQHAFGSAGTQSAGLWEFLRTGAHSKQLHTAHAAGAGLMAAYLAKDGFTGAADIFCGPQGMAAGMSSDADPTKLVDRLGTRWATVETSFKYHASCRHTHPAADALLSVMRTHNLQASDLAHIQAHVHQGAIDVLGPVVDPSNVHQSKFSMGTVLALAARFGHAGLREFDLHFADEETRTLCARVAMVLDPEVDRAYPVRWIGKVTVRTTDGRELHAQVDEPKGDPGNTLNREEISQKAMRLAAFSQAVKPEHMHQAVQALWAIGSWARVGWLLEDAPA